MNTNIPRKDPRTAEDRIKRLRLRELLVRWIELDLKRLEVTYADWITRSALKKSLNR